MSKNPLFLQFINREKSVSELLRSFSKSTDKRTTEAVLQAMNSPPDLEEFHEEITDAVTDLVRDGLGEEFKDFVNHYMEPLEEDVEVQNTPHGENRSQVARVKDEKGPWIQGFICYNLCLYTKAFGLENLKKCRVCGKLFAHKGKWAVYCSDQCKKQKR